MKKCELFLVVVAIVMANSSFSLAQEYNGELLADYTDSLIETLDDPDFDVRQSATIELTVLCHGADKDIVRPKTLDAHHNHGRVEVRWRCGLALDPEGDGIDDDDYVPLVIVGDDWQFIVIDLEEIVESWTSWIDWNWLDPNYWFDQMGW